MESSTALKIPLRFALDKVIVEQRQLMATFDDTATLKEIQYPNTDDLEEVCEV